MFCYQRGFNSPTRVISAEQFWALVKAPETARKVKEAREALAKGDKATYDRKKKGLPLMIFIGTFDESEKTFEDKKTGEKRTVTGCWRNQANVRLNGLVVADYDHLEGDVRKIWEEAFAKLNNEDKERILFVFITPSGHGLKVVFMADPEVGNLIDNQLVMSSKLGLSCDDACKDGCRGAFQTTDKDIIFINEEKLFDYENKTFGDRYNALYRDGHSQGTNPPVIPSVAEGSPEISPCATLSRDDKGEKSFKGIPYSDIIAEWWKQNGGEPQEGERNVKLYQLAVSLRAICDNSRSLLMEVMPRLGLSEEELRAIIDSACKEPPKGIGKALKSVLAAVGGLSTGGDSSATLGMTKGGLGMTK